MNLKDIAKKEIDKISKVMENLEIIEDNELLSLAKSYWEDANHFYEKGMYLQAFEAAVIVWAYLDALLHFNKIKIPTELKHIFTVS